MGFINWRGTVSPSYFADIVIYQTGVFLYVVLALAFFLRVYALGTLDIWYDEAITYLVGQKSLNYFDPSLVNDKPPLNYLFFYLWGKLGDSISFVRMLSVVCGTAGTYVVYLLGRRAYGESTAIVAALLYAVSPFEILHSREISGAIIAQFFVLASVLMLEKYLSGEGRQRVAFSLLLQVLAVFTSYTALLLIPCQNLVVFLRRKEGNAVFSTWLKFQAVALLPVMLWLFASWKTHIVEASGYISTWVPSLELVGYASFFNNLYYGYYIRDLAGWILLLPLALFAANGIRDARSRSFAVYSILPLFLILLIGVWSKLVMQRYLICYVPMMILLLARGIVLTERRSFRWMALGWIFAGVALSLNSYYGERNILDSPVHNRAKEYGRISEFLKTETVAGERIFHSSQNSLPVLEVLNPGMWRNEWLVSWPVILRNQAPFRYTCGRLGVDFLEPVPLDPDRLRLPAWFVFSSWPSHPYLDDEVNHLRERLERVAVPERVERFGCVDLVRYVPRHAGAMDIVASESGGGRLYKDMGTGEKFPTNYPILKAGFKGHELFLDDGLATLETRYPSSDVMLEVLEGVYPLDFKDGELDGFDTWAMVLPSRYIADREHAISIYSNRFLSSTITGGWVEGKGKGPSINIKPLLPPGKYELYMRVLKEPAGGYRAAIGVSADGETIRRPEKPESFEQEWGWVSGGIFDTDGSPAIEIYLEGEEGRRLYADLHMAVLVPLDRSDAGESGWKSETERHLARGGKIEVPLKNSRGYTLAIASDPARREIMVVRKKGSTD